MLKISNKTFSYVEVFGRLFALACISCMRPMQALYLYRAHYDVRPIIVYKYFYLTWEIEHLYRSNAFKDCSKAGESDVKHNKKGVMLKQFEL